MWCASPLGQIREALTKTVKYQNVPQTAAPRRSKPDQALYQAQRKMEELLNMYIHLAETKDMQHLKMATALARSAWEDLQQSRRHLMAGKQSHKLEPRTDDQTPKLLTKEEEKRLRDRPIQRWRPQPQSDLQTTASSSENTGKKPAWTGKGKCKGAKGTSNSNQL